MSRAVELLYQPRCPACDAALPREAPLCDPCAESLYPTGPACAACAEPREADVERCDRCRRDPPPYGRLIAPFRFGGELATALRRLKFRNRPDIARQLSPLLGVWLAAAAAECDLLVPVPLSWRRQFSRGYNQSDLLLSYARRAARLELPIERLALRRVRNTRPQPGLTASARTRNVSGAFDVRPPHRRRVQGRRILLFDDVTTTGATLAAATAALLRAGATGVDAMSAARAE